MANLTGKQILYLVLALLGVCSTWYFNLQIPPEELSSFFIDAFATPLSSSLTVDLLVALLTWIVWMIPEARRLEIKTWLVVVLILLTFAVAFAFTFPLFMFFRERALQKLNLDG